MRAVDAVVSGAVENAYALVRPPGHHAEPDRGRGYCIFGNIAVAIMYARARLGVTRVAVVDWDVHHGNGTQRAFYEAPNVLTISIHQDNLYPANSGAVSENGAGSGLGYNLNIPMPPGSGGGAYLAAFERLIVPALRRFKPELIMVASGLDAGGFDPLGCMMLHSEHYRRLTRLILEVSCISPHTGHGDPRSQGLVRSNHRNGPRCHRRGDRSRLPGATSQTNRGPAVCRSRERRLYGRQNVLQLSQESGGTQPIGMDTRQPRATLGQRRNRGREFEIVPLVAVDAVLADRKIDDWDELIAVKPEQLRRWVDADAVVYGEILNYEAYWAGLISVWRVTARVRMVSTRDGHEIFTAQSHRYSVDLAPAIDPIDIGINSVQTLIDLRDLRLARAEYEVGREIVMRLPVSSHNIAQLQNAAIERERGLEDESEAPTTSRETVHAGPQFRNSR
jgi:hypothetical protein